MTSFRPSNKYRQERIMYYNGPEKKTPSQALGTDVNFTKVIFRPILIGLKTVEVIGSWFPERPTNFYSELSRENSTVVITILLSLTFPIYSRSRSRPSIGSAQRASDPAFQSLPPSLSPFPFEKT